MKNLIYELPKGFKELGYLPASKISCMFLVNYPMNDKPYGIEIHVDSGSFLIKNYYTKESAQRAFDLIVTPSFLETYDFRKDMLV